MFSVAARTPIALSITESSDLPLLTRFISERASVQQFSGAERDTDDVEKVIVGLLKRKERTCPQEFYQSVHFSPQSLFESPNRLAAAWPHKEYVLLLFICESKR